MTLNSNSVHNTKKFSFYNLFVLQMHSMQVHLPTTEIVLFETMTNITI